MTSHWLHCGWCKTKLFRFGAGVTVRTTRPVSDNEPLEDDEVEAICMAERCKQRWALKLVVARVA